MYCSEMAFLLVLPKNQIMANIIMVCLRVLWVSFYIFAIFIEAQIQIKKENTSPECSVKNPCWKCVFFISVSKKENLQVSAINDPVWIWDVCAWSVWEWTLEIEPLNTESCFLRGFPRVIDPQNPSPWRDKGKGERKRNGECGTEGLVGRR